MEEERLFVVLEARVAEFEHRMKQAERRGTQTYQGLQRGSRTATRAMEQDMVRSTGRINAALASTSGRIGKLQGALAGFRSGPAAAGLTAIAAAVLAAGKSASAAAGQIARLGDEAKRAGVSAQAFQEWKFVAEQNRIPVDAMVDSLKELNLRADEFVVTGQGPAAEAFGRLGYGAEELQEKLKDPSALLLEIIGRLQRLDKAAQIRVADEIFGGTGGERFVELIDQGEAGIRATIDRAHELGIVMSDELIDRAADLDRRFNEVATTVGVALKTAIVEAATALGDFIAKLPGLRGAAHRGAEATGCRDPVTA